MQAALQVLYPDGSADDFVAGAGWCTNFFKRFGLSMRVATNVMSLSVEERIPRCLRFFEVIQRVCAERGGMNRVWGRYTPSHRYNADEVPLEFGAVLTRTAEIKGSTRVWLKHPKHRIDNRECTLMPLFCGGAPLPFSCILLRCKPRQVDAETVEPRTAAHGPTRVIIEKLRQKYPNVDIYCQANGYMDACTFLTWFKFTFLPSAGSNPNLLVVDNLSAHATTEMREFAAAHNVCLLFTPPNCTDMIQVTDIGLGHALKGRVKKKFLVHFRAHTDRWVRGEVSPGDRKKLHVQWLSEATKEFYNAGGQNTVETIFGMCGLRTPLDESGPQLRRVKGYKQPIVVKWKK